MAAVEPVAMKHRRLLRLAGFIAQHEEPVTTDRICQRFGGSARSAYRQISNLKRMGVPVRGEAGVGYALRKEAPLQWIEEAVWGAPPKRTALRVSLTVTHATQMEAY